MNHPAPVGERQSHPWAAARLALCAGALFACQCSHAVKTAPEPGALELGNPAQPSADDFVSAFEASPQGWWSGPGPCGGGWAEPTVEAAPDSTGGRITVYPRSSPHQDGQGPVLAAAWGEPEATALAVFDQERGLRVLDARVPSAPRVTAATQIGRNWPHELLTAGDLALLIVRRDGGVHELLWFRLSRSEAPVLLRSLRAAGEVHAAYAIALADGSTHAVVVADSYTEPRPGAGLKRSGTTLRSYALTAEPGAQVPELVFPKTLARVMRAGDLLVLEEGPVEGLIGTLAGAGPIASSVRVARLADAQHLELSTALPSDGGVRAVAARGTHLTLLWSRARREPAPKGRNVAEYHLVQAELTPARELRAAHACQYDAFSGPNTDPNMFQMPPQLYDALLTPDAAVLLLQGDGPDSLALTFRGRSCEPARTTLHAQKLLSVGDGGQMIGLYPAASDTLHVELYDAGRLQAPLVRATARLDTSGGPWLRLPHSANEYAVSSARVLAAAGRRWLTVPFYETDPRGLTYYGTQLFSLEPDALRVAGKLRSWLWHASATGLGVGHRESGIDLIDLSAEGGPRGVGESDLWQRFAAGTLLEHGSARVRWPSPNPADGYDPSSNSVAARLELLAQDAAPQTGAAVADFAISPRASLHRVGSLLVSVTQRIEPNENPARQPCLIEVFDVADPARARKTASFEVDTLCGPGHALADQPTLTLPNALVFQRTESRYRGPSEIVSQRIALHVLDLRDPSAPRFAGPFRTPDGEWALAAFAEGARIAIASRIVPKVAAGRAPVAHHYLRSIDFSDPAHPRSEVAVSVPGEPKAVAGERVLTLDTFAQGTGFEHSVREVRLRGGRAEPIGALAVGALLPISVAPLPNGRALITTLEPRVRVTPGPDCGPTGSRVRVVDLPHGTVLANQATATELLSADGVAGTTALLHDLDGVLHTLDLRSPATAKLEMPSNGAHRTDQRGDTLLLERRGVLELRSF